MMSTYWYVLHSKPHKEEMLAEQLDLRRIETFAPRIRVQVVNRGPARSGRTFPDIYLFGQIWKNWGCLFYNTCLDPLG